MDTAKKLTLDAWEWNLFYTILRMVAGELGVLGDHALEVAVLVSHLERENVTVQRK